MTILDRIKNIFLKSTLSRKEIFESKLFDSDWYRNRHKDVADAGVDPLNHFFSYGLAEGRDPGPLFSVSSYNKMYPDVEASSHEAFTHFILWGRNERRNPHPLFNVEFYREQSKASLADDFDALDHYFNGGWKTGWRPNPWFDSLSYAAANQGEHEQEIPPLLHYSKYGFRTNIDLSPSFSQRFYLERYPKVVTDWVHTPLHHYIEYGRDQGFDCIPDIAWVDEFYSWSGLKKEIRDALKTKPKQPVVSIVIPVYNQFWFTMRCVKSILDATENAELEIIIADDCSSDESEIFFSSVKGITYIRNSENLGFLKSCNNATKFARGEYIYFLNNDTAVLPGWVDSILESFHDTPGAGLIGSKLIYPDGKLQEAGGIIWQDGSSANVGRYGDRYEPGYLFLRDVDYVSGAGIMVPTKIWNELGGFDVRYVPAYCEDSDFCMRLKQYGYRVLVQPASEVIHFEGVSSGKSLMNGIKSYQVKNQKKLKETWSYNLELHKTTQVVDQRKLAGSERPRILILDAIVPEPDKDAGSITAFFFMKLFLKMGYQITFIPTSLYGDARYTKQLQILGVEVLYAPYVSDIKEYASEFGHLFNLFFLYRVNDGGEYYQFLKQRFPEIPVIFNTVDLHYLREIREARLSNSGLEGMNRANDTKSRELSLIRSATDTIVLSTAEVTELKAQGISRPMSVIPLVLENSEKVKSRLKRTGIVFVGGFQHTPNIDSVFYFVKEIWPLVRKQNKKLEFHIVGSNPPQSILELTEEPGIIVHGFVENLNALLDERILSIAPLRYGAGIKGKIGSSLAAGLPCVASKIAVEGMGLTEGHDVLVAENSKDFAAKIITLTKNTQLWQSLSNNGRDFTDENYSLERTYQRLLELFAKNNITPFSGTCSITGNKTIRRFDDVMNLDTLQDDNLFANSSERILAASILKYWKTDHKALTDLSSDVLEQAGAVILYGDLPVLKSQLSLLAIDFNDGGLLAAKLDMSTLTIAKLNKMMAAAPQAREIALAIVQGEASKNQVPVAVEFLTKKGWMVRTRLLPLPESILTKTVLVEAKIPS